MPMSTIAALVPFPSGAAPRLNGARGALRRRGFAIADRWAALQDTLLTLLHAEIFLVICVVSHDRTLRRLCRKIGAPLLLPPPRVRGRAAELRWAAARAEVAGADRLLVAQPERGPFSSSTLFRLALPPIERGVRIIQSADGVVEALLLAPPDLLLVLPGSYRDAARVQQAARRHAISFTSFSRPATGPVTLPRRGRRTGPMLIDPETLGLARHAPDGARRYAKRRRARHTW